MAEKKKKKAKIKNWTPVAKLRKQIADRERITRAAQDKHGGPEETRAKRDPGNQHK